MWHGRARSSRPNGERGAGSSASGAETGPVVPSYGSDPTSARGGAECGNEPIAELSKQSNVLENERANLAKKWLRSRGARADHHPSPTSRSFTGRRLTQRPG